MSNRDKVLIIKTGLTIEPLRKQAGDFEPHHSFRFGDWAWGVQFHPEFTAAIIAAYIRNRQDEINLEGLNPVELAESIKPAVESMTLLKTFADLVSRKSRRVERPHEPLAE